MSVSRVAGIAAAAGVVLLAGCTFKPRLCPDGPLRVFVFFGYKDARPARFVGDRYEEALLAQAITRPCVPGDGREDCGFKAAPDGVYERTITRASGCLRPVELETRHSSVGPDDDENRRDPYQAWRSNRVRGEFVDALQASAQVVYYNGHSRAGGGPDFEPPKLDASRHTHYAWYKQEQPGLRLIERALAGAPGSPLEELGLFSCASEQLFDRRIKTAKPGVRLISSRRLIYFSDAIRESLDSLSKVLVVEKQGPG